MRVEMVYVAPRERCAHLNLPKDHETPMGDEYLAGSVVLCECGYYFVSRRYEGTLLWDPVRWYDFKARKRIREYEEIARDDRDLKRRDKPRPSRDFDANTPG